MFVEVHKEPCSPLPSIITYPGVISPRIEESAKKLIFDEGKVREFLKS
mgnify:FL=1